METWRTFFVDSVSSTQVQLARKPGAGGEPHPNTDPGIALHRITIITGNASAANADTAFWQGNCVLYDVMVRRRT